MAIYLRDFDSGRVHCFLGTLATAASYWHHRGATIDVQLDDDNFAAAPLDMSLASLLAPDAGLAGNGSRDAPFTIRVVTAGSPSLPYAPNFIHCYAPHPSHHLIACPDSLPPCTPCSESASFLAGSLIALLFSVEPHWSMCSPCIVM